MKGWLKAIVGLVATVAVLFTLFVAAMWMAFKPENWQKRKARFEKAAANGTVLIGAIRSYEAANGKPPPFLGALTPSFIETIPGTGLPDYPTFKYQVFTESKSSLAWYDLGSREGKPMAGLWVHMEGDPEHAILALTLDQHERVVDARADRMPEQYTRTEFDIEKWKRNEARIQMVRALAEKFMLKDRPFAEVSELLGKPNGVSILRNSPWELRIECGGPGLNWDVFFFWPTLAYPQHIYGGSTERIGDWVYVHE